jgi:RNA-directed DNA polymerase
MSLETPEKIRTFQRKLYRKAKAEPAFRFYVLYDKICREDILRHAYALARFNAGAPGADGVTFAQIKEQGVEAWLAGLREELASKTYRPDPVRRVNIPKPGGGERPLGIPTIRDRVVQTAAKLVLDPIFEADFEDNAYGYRPARGAVDAVKEVHRHICRGYTDVVDADLSKYFDTIPHSELIKSVARRIADGAVLRLIKLWLKAPIEEREGDDDGKRHMSGGKGNKRGTPQGGVVSPLLANIYMNRFLKYWRLTGRGEAFRAQVISYADDFVILSRGCGRGPGVDEGRDDAARAEHQRGQNLAEECPAGTFRLPGLLVRATPLQSERHVVPEREPVQEECAAVEGEGWQSPGAGQHRSMAGSSRRAEQVPVRLVELLLLWDTPPDLPRG